MTDPHSKRMTLREYVSCHVMARFAALPLKHMPVCKHHKAQEAVLYADALIEALNMNPSELVGVPLED